jgi:hypothetical protein
MMFIIFDRRSTPYDNTGLFNKYFSDFLGAFHSCTERTTDNEGDFGDSHSILPFVNPFQWALA